MQKPQQSQRISRKNVYRNKTPAVASSNVRFLGFPSDSVIPFFEKLDANLAKAILSIGAVKGFEIGAGFGAATATGLTNNDAFCMENGHISKRTNYSGGTLGGMSDGSLLFFRAAVKPTPSIGATQQTVNKDGKEIEISIKGRHDPIIVPRAVVVVEAMTAITIFRCAPFPT